LVPALKRILKAALLALTALSVANVGALAQSAGTGNPEGPRKLLEDTSIPAHHVELTLGKARLVKLPAEARDVVIANPATADIVIKTPTLAYLVGREVGGTNAYFLDAEGNEILRLEVQVQIDVESVRNTLNQLLPNTNVKVTAVNNDLFLTGSVRSADVSENARQIASRFVSQDASVINMLAIIEDQQVLLQVRVAEVSRNILKELGVNLFDTLSGTATGFTTLTSGDFNSRVGTTNGFVDAPFLSGLFRYNPVGGDALTLVINALERNGLIKTLAEPNLTTVSGEPATFLAGGEFPIPIASRDGQISIQMEPFGVALNFTPVVMNSGRISLRIFTEVSALTDDGAITLQNIRIPALTVRRAETTVELPSGGSLVIAGLLQDDVRTGIRGVPGFKDLPVLGPFFRNNTLQKSENELIVTVTAMLVRPVDPDQLRLPTDGVGTPSDYELYFLGRLQTLYAKDSKPQKAAALRGPIGYIVE
jgi:pilus assembly protein CpaC